MRVGGIDEVGRGPLAGPVVVAAVVFGAGADLNAFHDSKILSARRRQKLAFAIQAQATSWSIVEVPPVCIDAINIREATKLAMAFAASEIEADEWLIDGNMGFAHPVPQRTIIKGDATERVIGAASIVAKEYRDCLMRKLSEEYVEYGFDRHAGYPTSRHRNALLQVGASSVHRLTFRGVAQVQRGKYFDNATYLGKTITIHSSLSQQARTVERQEAREMWRRVCSQTAESKRFFTS